MHDCWTSYFGLKVGGHQICTAHLLRELKYLVKLYQQRWTESFSGLLDGALELKKKMLAQEALHDSKLVQERKKLEEDLDRILEKHIDQEHKKLIAFKKRIIRYRNYLFPFLYHLKVPPDNNASERAIRTCKVKQKVSGLFRSQEGANAFAIIRSVIDTTIKNTKNVWEALAIIPTLAVVTE